MAGQYSKRQKTKMPGSGYERFEKTMAAIDELAKDTSASGRVSAVIAALDGFELTGATIAVRESLEAWGVQYNRLIKAAQESTGGEIASLSEPDAAELIPSIHASCELIRSIESERVLESLRDDQRRIPKAEIQLIRQYPHWFIPLLIRECAAETEKIEQSKNKKGASSDAVSSVPFFTLYLASELAIAEFLPVLLRGLKLPGEGSFDLYGDTIHQEVPRLLAQFLHDDIDRIDELVLDASLNIYVRWCSASSYQYLVRDKRLTLEEAVQRLDRLFAATKVAGETGRPGMGHPYELSAGIVEVLASIGGGALSMIGDSPEQWKYIDESVIHQDDFVSSVAPTDASRLTSKLIALPATRLEDCIEEFRSWGSFREDGSTEEYPAPIPKPTSRPEPRPESTPLPNPRVIQSLPQPEVAKPVRSDRTPRNADCPCGSGKKYKKCCMLK